MSVAVFAATKMALLNRDQLCSIRVRAKFRLKGTYKMYSREGFATIDKSDIK